MLEWSVMNTARCIQCGLVNSVGTPSCRRCGAGLPHASTDAEAGVSTSSSSSELESTILEEYTRSADNPRIMGGSSALMMGKLVLTNRRILFLSSGENTVSQDRLNGLLGMFGGLLALIGLFRMIKASMREKEIIRSAARSLTLSDLMTAGSWAYDLTSISLVRVVGGVWQRRYLRIEAAHGGGTCAQGIYRLGLTKKDLLEMKARIDAAIEASL